MRLVRKSSAHAHGITNLSAAPHSREGDVVDLRIRAPRRATRRRHLEFARQIIELGIRDQCVRHFAGKRRSVDDLVVRDTREWAACHIADHIAACSFGRESNPVESIHDLRNRLDGEPVELNVLSSGDVCQVARVGPRDVGDHTKLRCGDDPVGHPDAHHEVVAGQPFATLAADRPHSVALRVDAPPFEVSAGPLRDDA